VGLIGGNQHTGQIEDRRVLTTYRANIQTMIAFGLKHEDAPKVAPDFPPLNADDLKSLPKFTMAARIMTPDGLAPTTTVSTLKPPEPTGHGPAALAASWAAYGMPAADIEAALRLRHSQPATGRKRPSIGREEP
jgi:hypothetical protein